MPSSLRLYVVGGLAGLVSLASAQTFQRLGACPTLGCVFPPDQTDFYPGQLFDIRLEVHAPVNGTEAFNNGVPDEKFTFCIQKGKGACTDVTKFFKVQDPALEKWSFTYVVCSCFLRLTLKYLLATMKTSSPRMQRL